MGTHNSKDKELQLFGKPWKLSNFRNQFSLHPVIIALTCISIVMWLPTFVFMIFRKER